MSHLIAPERVTAEVYDDLANGEAYEAKWAMPMPNVEPESERTRSFGGGRLQLQAVPFTVSADSVEDHIKYYAISTKAFAIPERGSIEVTAAIEAQTPGAVAGHVVPTTGRALLEGQQAAAVIGLTNIEETGQLFDWFVSGSKAFIVAERLAVGVGFDKAYTQVVAEFDISRGTHAYTIRYSRAPLGPDQTAYLIDGRVVAETWNAGIPLDVQSPRYYARHPVTYPSLGPGELVKDQMTHFKVIHGLFTLLDEFPFNAVPERVVSIPREERVFGQGVIATFANVTVTTTELV